MKSPISIVFTVCSVLKHWAGLYGEEDREAIRAGAEQLIKKAREMAVIKPAGSDPGGQGILRLTYK